VHHRQSPQSNNETNETAEQAVLRQVRTSRLRALFAGTSAIAFSMFAVGCPEPADLENPPPNMTGGTGTTATAGTGNTTAGTGTTGGTGGVIPNCESDCIKKMFVMDVQPCKLCHGTGTALGGLDLQSAGFTDRLKDKPAKHTDGMGPPEAPLPGCTSADLLINSAAPEASWLWKKVTGTQGAACGTPMPQPPSTLTSTQTACVKTYIECVAGKPMAGGTGGSGTGGSGTGGTGGSTGGGGGTGGT
jgi:hypothetical protein